MVTMIERIIVGGHGGNGPSPIPSSARSIASWLRSTPRPTSRPR